MAQGTKLFQEPGSPLIQGRSRTQRPGWQPFLVGVACALGWSFVSHLLHALALADSTSDRAGLLSQTVSAWFATGLLWLVPSAMAGALIGIMVAVRWGFRRRWVVASVGGVGAWYLALLAAVMLK